MVLGIKPMGKPSTQRKNHKFWTEPMPSMILGLKPMGKPSTQRKKYKFWTEPGPCMVLGLKPMVKLSIPRKKLQVLDRTNALYGPRTKAYGETKYSKKKKKTTSFGQNQGLVWSLDSRLWGNQVLKEKTASFGQNQGLVWSSDSSIWGNQVIKEKKKLQVLDRTKALYGPRTQAFGETKYSKKKLQVLDKKIGRAHV